jgi:hypothetical protein
MNRLVGYENKGKSALVTAAKAGITESTTAKLVRMVIFDCRQAGKLRLVIGDITITPHNPRSEARPPSPRRCNF